MPEEVGIDRYDPLFTRMLDVRGRPKLPDTMLSTLMAVVPIFGTTPWANVLFDSVVGAAGVLDVELTKTPEAKIRVPVAVEFSHNEATTHNLRLFFKWDRAGVTTSVCIAESEIALGQNAPLPIRDFSRLYLGPTARIQGTLLSMGGAAQATLKMAYIELPLGETAPP